MEPNGRPFGSKSIGERKINQSVHGEYNLISAWFNKILKSFFCVYEKMKLKNAFISLFCYVFFLLLKEKMALKSSHNGLNACKFRDTHKFMILRTPKISRVMGNVTKIFRVYTQRNLFQILLNQPEIRLYLPCTD